MRGQTRAPYTMLVEQITLTESAHGFKGGRGGVNMKVSGGARLVSSSTGKAQLEVAGRPMFELNPVAVFIWQQLARKLSADMIVVQLVALFGASQEQARRDVTNFIALLKKHWLVYDDERCATSSPTPPS